MTLLMEATVRSLALGTAVGLGLWISRTSSARLKMTAWTLVLAGALLMPFLMQWQTVQIRAPRPVVETAPLLAGAVHAAVSRPAMAPLPRVARTSWRAVLLPAYALTAALLLLRVITGFVLTLRVWRRAVPVREPWLACLNVRETSAVAAPATFGSGVLLPAEWRQWDDLKRRAVLAHETAHVECGDFYVQLLSRLHLAIFWFSPLAWWLQNRLTVLAEAASDDAALQAVDDRPSYAEILLYFARKPHHASSAVAMARLGTVGRRVERILSGAARPSQADWKRYTLLAASVTCAVALVAGCSMQAQVQAPPAPAAPTAPVAAPQAPPTPPEPPQPQATWWRLSDSKGDSWAIVSGDSLTMSGSAEDAERARSYRDRIHGEYIWFQHDGKAYLITDPALVARARQLFRPQEELGRRQEELGRQQALLGQQQAQLGEQQAKAGVRMPEMDEQVRALRSELRELDKRLRNGEVAGLAASDLKLEALEKELREAKDKELTQDRLAELQERASEVQAHFSTDVQNRLAELQSRMSALQAQFGNLQALAGQMQSKLGEQQSGLGEKQALLGEEQSKLGEQQSELAEKATRQIRNLFDEALRNGHAQPAQ